MWRRPAQTPRHGSQRRVWLGLWALAAIATWVVHSHRAAQAFALQAPQPPARRGATHGRTARSASILDSIKNPVKTVADTIADFYKVYDKPPVLPMYRPFLIDFLTQIHLIVVDSRFKYDVVFALGVKEYYKGLMGSYDKLVGSPQSDKIWEAMIKAVGLQPGTVAADAEVATTFATSTPAADILKLMEGPDSSKIGAAFTSIGSSLYHQPFSIGLFKMMELAGVEVSKANAEEWAKALKITPAKVTSDLETYKLNKGKLQKAEEMIREVEIREKKKLAERLEAKAKALAAKAAEKAAAKQAPEAKSEA